MLVYLSPNVYNSGLAQSLAIRAMVSPSVVINDINEITSTNVHRECVSFVYNSRNKRTLMGN